jgi:putative ATP-dependent endonuclease of the OLD family
MKVARLHIKNFRAIRSATLHFEGHTLLVGMNNVGKSTICEALELVLGLDRLRRFPPVEECDFHNSRYLDKTTQPPTPIPIEVEVVLVDLSEELASRCVDRIEGWHAKERRLLGMGEIDQIDDDNVTICLRLKAIAIYNPEEDEFEARSVFCGGPAKDDGELTDVPRSVIRIRFAPRARGTHSGRRT